MLNLRIYERTRYNFEETFCKCITSKIHSKLVLIDKFLTINFSSAIITIYDKNIRGWSGLIKIFDNY